MPADHIAHGVRSFKMKREYPVYSTPRRRHYSKHLLGGCKHERQAVSGSCTPKNTSRQIDVS